MPRLFSPENIIERFSRRTVVVAEGEDLVLQKLTVLGKYYVIEVWDEKDGKVGLVSYRKTPETFPPHLAEHPYPSREAAEAGAEYIRGAQIERAREISSHELFAHKSNCSEKETWI